MRLSDEEMLRLTGTLPQNVNYAVKSSYVLAFLEPYSKIRKSLEKPSSRKIANVKDTIKKVKEATVMIIVY